MFINLKRVPGVFELVRVLEIMEIRLFPTQNIQTPRKRNTFVYLDTSTFLCGV